MAEFFKKSQATGSSESEKEENKLGSIWQLPANLRISVLKKSDARSIARLRRASKALDSVVQENDVRIRSRHTFVITITRPSLEVAPTSSFWVTTEGMIDHDGSGRQDINARLLTAIEDPVKQLNGFSFVCVLLNFEFHRSIPKHYMWTHFVTNVLPILRKFRPRCEFLYFKGISNVDITYVFPHISFSSLTFGDCLISPSSMSWDVNNGNILNIRHLQMIDLQRAIPACRQFRTISVSVLANPSFYSVTERNLKLVLKEISENPIGRMQTLRFAFIGSRWAYIDMRDYQENKEKEYEEIEDANDNGDSSDDDEDAEDRSDIWDIGRIACVETIRSKISNGAKYHKVRLLNGGQAIVVQTSSLLEDHKKIEFMFYFFEKYSKTNLFEVCFKEASGASDLETAIKSPFFRSFIKTKTEADALHSFYTYQKDLEKWIKYRDFVDPDYSDDEPPCEEQSKETAGHGHEDTESYF